MQDTEWEKACKDLGPVAFCLKVQAKKDSKVFFLQYMKNKLMFSLLISILNNLHLTIQFTRLSVHTFVFNI